MQKGIDHIGVSVVYFCHDGDGNVLLSKRSETCRDEHGCWDLGGGGVEFGDTVKETLEKELREEYCTGILDYEFLGYRDVHRGQGDTRTCWVMLDFKVLIDKDKAKNGEPHKFDEVRWFPINDLPKPLHSQLPHFLKKYKEQL